MSKLHGDFGDLSRYDVMSDGGGVELGCQDCDSVIAQWPYSQSVPLDELTRAASEHETAEESDDAVPDDAVPVDKLDELREHFNDGR